MFDALLDILRFICLFEFDLVFLFRSCPKYANYSQCLKILPDANLVKRFLSYLSIILIYNMLIIPVHSFTRSNHGKTVDKILLYFNLAMTLRRDCHSTRKWHGNDLRTIFIPIINIQPPPDSNQYSKYCHCYANWMIQMHGRKIT